MKPRCGVVVADDLTGANATGVLLVQRGIRALSLLAADDPALGVAMQWLRLNGVHSLNGHPATLVFNTDSRTLPAEQAADRVRRVLLLALQHVQAASVVAKRIDSTARGNLPSEVAAALEVLGPTAFAVVTPAYPASGRTVVGGYLLMNGVPVTRTGAARDPIAPVRHAHVPTLFETDQPWPVGHIGLVSILKGLTATREALLAQVRTGLRIVVADAVSDEDIESLAEALVDVATALGVPAVCADPGPLAAAVFDRLLWPIGREKRQDPLRTRFAAVTGRKSHSMAGLSIPSGPVLVVAGSTTQLTARQLAALEREFRVAFEVADVAALAAPDTSQSPAPQIPDQYSSYRKRYHEVERLVSFILSHWTSACCVGVRTVRGPEDLPSGLSRSRQQELLQGLGQVVRLALERASQRFGSRPAGLYLTGGDLTATVVKDLGAVAIELGGEVLPLAAIGHLIGGPFEGLSIVSKGGLVGGEDAAIRCVEVFLPQRAKSTIANPK